MTSPAQLAANRANAQRSTGPVTEAGKQTVGHNALRHGLTGNVHAALPGEEDAMEIHCEGFRKSYAPVGKAEQELVRNLAENYWRLKRAHAMENALFAQVEREQTGAPAAEAQANAFIDPLKGLQRIALYANRIQRSIEKAATELKAIQAIRKAARAQAEEEAVLLSKHSAYAGQTYDPAPDFPSSDDTGFVYSASEIARLIDRSRRLEEARALFAPACEAAFM
jgi:hypothetical protein